MKVETLAEIEGAEFSGELGLRGDDLIERAQIFIATPAERVRDRRRASHFGSDKPKREDKWQTGGAFPFGSEIPVVECVAVFCAKTQRLIADEQARLTGAGSDDGIRQPRLQSSFRQENAQEICRRARRGVERDLLDFFHQLLMREKDAVVLRRAGDSDIVHDAIPWLAQVFEAGDKSDVQFTGR